MLLLGTLLVETSLTVVTKSVGQVPNMKMIGESIHLQKALEILNTKRKDLDAELLAIKEMQVTEVVKK